MGHPLQGRHILIVDDEADVRETIALVLSECVLDMADSYESARAKLSTRRYDAAILDIMGVRGHELLEEFAWAVPCVMLTAHALTAADLEASLAKRAVLFLPKEEMTNLERYLAKLLEGEPLATPYPAPRSPRGHGRAPLFGWLFEQIDFTRWFGRDWKPPKTPAGHPPRP